MLTITEEKIAYIQLSSTPGIGYKTIEKLINFYGDASNTIEKIVSLGKEYKLDINSRENTIKIINKTLKIGGEIYTIHDKQYPDSLKNISNPPPIIFVLGNQYILDKKKKIAIIGSRNPTLNSINLTQQISLDLANNDFVTVSGMALGIDSIANSVVKHDYPTIAVLGNGFDNTYPQENYELSKIIQEKGILISEFPTHIKPKKSHFPRRNRIIAGLVQNCLVIESRINSGSLITAKHIMKDRKKMFVIPGIPNDSRFAGNNMLLKKGATLVENAQDIIEGYNYSQNDINIELSDINKINNDLNSDDEIFIIRNQILNLISYNDTSINNILDHLKKDFQIQNILITIIDLEIDGLIIIVNKNIMLK